jgi:hypothetical protein
MTGPPSTVGDSGFLKLKLPVNGALPLVPQHLEKRFVMHISHCVCLALPALPIGGANSHPTPDRFSAVNIHNLAEGNPYSK